MFGRRPDARPATDVSTVRRFMPYISPTRNQSLVYYRQDVAIDAAEAWLAERNAERPADDRLTLFHLILHAIARTLDERPHLNRFTKGGTLWQRDGIWLSFSAKKAFAEDAPILTVKRRVDPNAPIEVMVDGLLPPLRGARKGVKSTADKEMSVFLRLPGPVLSLMMRFAAWMDRWGLMPGSMIEADPLFCSAFVANLGSVGLEAGYHHLWEWGTCPIFCVIGRTRQTDTGRRVTLKWTYDERIADGFYAARALERVAELVRQPGD